MEAFRDFLDIFLSAAFLGGVGSLVAYVFSLKAGSRRDRIAMDVIRVSYLLFLSILVYALGGMGVACTGCGLGLIALVGIGLAIAVAGIRMDHLWGNRVFWLMLLVAVVALALWLSPAWSPSDLLEAVILVVTATAGAFTFIGLSWPIGTRAIWVVGVVRRRR